jgi:TolA-binding protein
MRMGPSRPIAPRNVTAAATVQPSKPVPSRDENQDAQIRSLQDRLAALEETLARLTSHISVNNLNELVIQADQSIFMQTNGSLQISASSIAKVSAAKIELAAGITVASGVIKTPTIIADSVVGKSYTPGAGNIW